MSETSEGRNENSPGIEPPKVIRGRITHLTPLISRTYCLSSHIEIVSGQPILHNLVTSALASDPTEPEISIRRTDVYISNFEMMHDELEYLRAVSIIFPFASFTSVNKG